MCRNVPVLFYALKMNRRRSWTAAHAVSNDNRVNEGCHCHLRVLRALISRCFTFKNNAPRTASTLLVYSYTRQRPPPSVDTFDFCVRPSSRRHPSPLPISSVVYSRFLHADNSPNSSFDQQLSTQLSFFCFHTKHLFSILTSEMFACLLTRYPSASSIRTEGLARMRGV